MLFLGCLTAVFSSEYLLTLLLRAHLLLFLGPGNQQPAAHPANWTAQLQGNLTKSLTEAGSELINGTYYYESSDNFDAYLTELGVGWLLRQAAMLAFPIVTVIR